MKITTLVELSVMANMVNEWMSDMGACKDHKTWMEISDMIAELEEIMPGNPLIQSARARWLLFGLADFEEHVAKMEGVRARKDRLGVIIKDLEPWFNRRFLGEVFGSVYGRMLHAFEKLDKDKKSTTDYWGSRVENMKSGLLDGRFE